MKEIGKQLKEKESPVVMSKIHWHAIKGNELHLPTLAKSLNDLKIQDCTGVLYLSFLKNKQLNKKNYNALKEYCMNKGIIHQNIDAGSVMSAIYHIHY